MLFMNIQQSMSSCSQSDSNEVYILKCSVFSSHAVHAAWLSAVYVSM